MGEEPKKGRLTLYENLLSADTLREMQARDAAKMAEEAKKKKDASLMFKPTNLGKKTKPAPKPKPTFSTIHKASSSVPDSSTGAGHDTYSAPEGSNTPQQQAGTKQPQKRGFDDWLANEDEEWEYYEKPQRERGGKNKKKKKNKHVQEQAWSWDDLYDPSLPVNFLDYPKSDAYYDVNEAWKQRLYDARKRERQRKGQDMKRRYSEDEDMSDAPSKWRNGLQFAPPANHSFAPPADDSSDNASRPRSIEPSSIQGILRPSFAPPAEINREETAEEAYARRLALSGQAAPSQPHVPPPVAQPLAVPSPPAAPPASTKPLSAEDAEKKAKAAAQIAAIKAKMAAKTSSPAPTPVAPHQISQSPSVPVDDITPIPEMTSPPSPPPPPPPQDDIPPAAVGTISAAPTFNAEYYAQTAQNDEFSADDSAAPASDPDAPRSRAPGQAGFAERLMAKMGYQKGQGLGADGTGITTAIVMKAEKRKKKSDAEGGGYVAPANMGKIVGGKKKKQDNAGDDDQGAHGAMSEVVKLEGMLANMDVDKEIQENNLMQEVGDEVAEFGKVERLFIWRSHMGGNEEVFIKFTSPLSALRAVREMDGVEFADNIVKAKFWDAEKFERDEYA